MYFLIVGSWFFYGFINISNLIHLILVIIITFFFAKVIRKNDKKKHLIIGITIIVIQLLLTKYSNILIQSFFNDKYSFSYILPIGISFYSLQAIGLLVDIKKRKYNSEISLKEVALFLSLFPQSIAGPIHRGRELLPQFKLKKYFYAENVVIGLKTMLWGYLCKLIIADKISLITTPIFNTYFEQEGLTIFIATLLYSFQIYFDFWGYSLIAIGAGRVLGFKININFIAPYSAVSFKDFWHRWHITLSKWMRDYIYIPLGGRKQKYYLYFFGTVLFTFVISGFWHGVSLNFLLWGAIHGFMYLIEDLIRRRLPDNIISSNFIISKLIKLFRIISFFILISFTWLIFRTENYTDLFNIIKGIINLSSWSMINTFNIYWTQVNIYYFILIFSILFISQSNFIKKKTETIPSNSIEMITDAFFVCLSLIVIIIWGDIGGQEFLYFKF